MRASALEFRLRVVILFAIVLLGFYAPWLSIPGLDSLGIGGRTSLLEWLALELSRLGLVSFAAATPIVIFLATLIAAFGAFFRICGTAYLDPRIVTSTQMHAGTIITSGPYRYVRNPLYLGNVFMLAAIAFAMPATGAALTLILVPLFVFRLILGEEKFLADKLGEPYQAYLRAVPRLLPRLRTTLPGNGQKPHWLQALLAEINPVGVLLVTAILWWRYDNGLIARGFLISFGLSLVVRAILPAPRVSTAE
jgi:protein-S-isoprenylcysteine O-methyltransferase Ste14